MWRGVVPGAVPFFTITNAHVVRLSYLPPSSDVGVVATGGGEAGRRELFLLFLEALRSRLGLESAFRRFPLVGVSSGVLDFSSSSTCDFSSMPIFL